MLTFNKKTVDPDSIGKDPRYSEKFKVEIYFKDVCLACKEVQRLQDICDDCAVQMEDEIESWKKILVILEVLQHAINFKFRAIKNQHMTKEFF
jgi:hypothetical protein